MIIKHLTEFILEFEFWKKILFIFGLRNDEPSEKKIAVCYAVFAVSFMLQRTRPFFRPFCGPWIC